MIRVLLVDDHAVVRMGFRLLLQSNAEISVIAEADSGETACQLYLELAPDVVIMDLAMPGMGGLEALRRIRARQPQAKVLALSAHDDLMHARRTLQEGALGFLSKRSAPETLLEAVSTVAAGRRYIEPALAQKLAIAEFDGGGRHRATNRAGSQAVGLDGRHPPLQHQTETRCGQSVRTDPDCHTPRPHRGVTPCIGAHMQSSEARPGPAASFARNS